MSDREIAALYDLVNLLVQKLTEEKNAKQNLIDALTPSASTKGAYIGEMKFSIEDQVLNEDTEEFDILDREILVPWTEQKKFMELILDYAWRINTCQSLKS